VSRNSSQPKAVLAGVACLMALASSATPALANTDHTVPSNTSQAKTAGLTGARTLALQRKVGRHLARTPQGHQTGPNTIAFPGGQITVTVPGERYARDLRTTHSPLSAMNCNYGNFCVTVDGDPVQLDYYYCGTYGVDYYGTGAWINNQTNSRRVRMNLTDGRTYTTPNAFFQDPTADWTPVSQLTTCVPKA
jgi:hypothetical protein